MSTYLINHLRIPGGIPNAEGLSYLEQVEATAKPYGGEWLAQGGRCRQYFRLMDPRSRV
jgi:uncharacterized protein (DUF1330 family)